MSFRLKTILGIALIELSVMAILIFVNQVNYGGTAASQLYDRARNTGQLLATMTADAVIATDLATIDATVANVLANDQLVYLRVRDAAGVPMSTGGDRAALDAPFRADDSFDAALDDRRIDLETPILINGQRFGSVEIGLSTVAVEARMASALRWNLTVAVLGMMLVALFGYILGSVLTAQLSSLRQGAQTITAGDLTARIRVRGRDELAETARCFNTMAESLHTDRRALEAKQADLIDKRDRVEQIVDCMKRIAGGAKTIDVPDADRADEIGDMARATIVFHEARSAQARLIQAFEQVDEQVVIFGTDGRAIFLNRAFRTFNADLLARLPHDFTWAQFLDAGLANGAFPAAEGQEEAWRARRLAPGDGALPVEIDRAPDRTLMIRKTMVDGIGMVVSASDVTELKISQAQLVQASKLATLGEMATGIAHELNQPLGVIRMAAGTSIKKMDKGQADSDYLRAKLDRIAGQTERAAQIINHMRVFGRTADQGSARFDLIEAVRNVCNLMHQQLSSVGIELRQDLPGGEIFASGQQVMFEQVLLNLITNARDAVEMGGENQKIVTVTLTGGIEAPSIHVSDTGDGVPEAILDRLFDPFFTTKEPGKGTGLGLSISYRIIQDMGGTISATNSETGATFRIDLPLAEEAEIAQSA